MKAFYSPQDNNNDGIIDCIMVFTKDFNEPLIGDYRGIQLAIIPFSNAFGKKRAEEIARIFTKALEDVEPYPEPIYG